MSSHHRIDHRSWRPLWLDLWTRIVELVAVGHERVAAINVSDAYRPTPASLTSMFGESSFVHDVMGLPIKTVRAARRM